MKQGRGWLLFSAVVLGSAGITRLLDALWALRYHGVVPENVEAGIFGHILNTYGWVYLIVAVIPVLTVGARAAGAEPHGGLGGQCVHRRRT